MAETLVPTDTELAITGIELLNRGLGATAALRFLSLLHRNPTDYVTVSRRLYEGQSIDEIVARARAQWSEQAREG
ncbi:MAG: hypothetical protein COZ06_11955 [Armatimonadetes bacterium CG_4_10_14_3_um_filter_66_18]|nr:hypothetical protein [Armatimonadota bacterium]OIO91533.1 MAG: hypothetical protein AUJ96_33730 [Armatimonadetes bacterium CG2_30_66_41]PIU91258.1 MAG: hypothetical protein COS65_22635 [Armatimonadetes bacterium CG06_land_8_20_14_3_00_66_21]PIX45394.1 MAG: hypothetical protein COZ57_15720 [Armatimonadetes bacterium CG_4_8_14_3_um_filter_66_20]PIY49948.1 MAG: hypothetical protein COZ06_11955 [Armatimonadetes bacterium CG_4_10_14_3_um_filter_66_18]PIZ35372.1 MAG: hypothetical protein COY42_26